MTRKLSPPKVLPSPPDEIEELDEDDLDAEDLDEDDLDEDSDLDEEDEDDDDSDSEDEDDDDSDSEDEDDDDSDSDLDDEDELDEDSDLDDEEDDLDEDSDLDDEDEEAEEAPRPRGMKEDPERAAIRKAFAAINPAEPMEVARLVAAALLDRKGAELVVIDVTGRTSYCDLIVLCNGSSARMVNALGKGVVDAFKETTNTRPLGVEGQDSGKWVLVDLGDVIVHVFQSALRHHYDLDGLWMDAPRLSLTQLGLNEKGEPLAPSEA